MNSATLSILFGLTSAVVWGAGDFSGGVAAKRNDVYIVVLFGHFAGFVGLLTLALVTGEPWPATRDLLFGALAGLGGMIGVLSFYSSLARSPMGVVAPVTAIVNVTLPLIFALFTEGFPPTLQAIGILFALIAVWFLSGAGGVSQIDWREFGLPVLAGFGFATFLILIAQVSETALYWPLAATRVASVTVVFCVMLLRRSKGFVRPVQLWLIVLAGLLDTCGNAFFALAAQVGRLDIASVLTSLYPASTVFLAWLILGERLTKAQKWGVVLTFIALILIAS